MTKRVNYTWPLLLSLLLVSVSWNFSLRISVAERTLICLVPVMFPGYLVDFIWTFYAEPYLAWAISAVNSL